MVGTGNYLAMSKGRHIFLHYLGDKSYHLAIGAKLDAKATAFQDSQTLWDSVLQTEFADWSDNLTTLVKTNKRNFRSWPLYAFPDNSVPWEHVSGATLIGDAAHLT